jgi:hypothetical protein
VPMPVNQITAAAQGTAKSGPKNMWKNMGSELRTRDIAAVSLPGLVERGVGVIWREITAAECMIGVSPLTLLYAFGMDIVAKDIATDVGV